MSFCYIVYLIFAYSVAKLRIIIESAKLFLSFVMLICVFCLIKSLLPTLANVKKSKTARFGRAKPSYAYLSLR